MITLKPFKTKALLFSLFFFSSVGAIAQDETTDTKKLGRFGTIELNIKKRTTKTVSEVYIIGFFQNAKYSHITDIGSFVLSDTATANKFCNDLLQAIELAGQDGKSHKWSERSYAIKLHDFSKRIYIEDPSGEQYTTISANQAIGLIDEIKRVKAAIK